MKLKSKSISFAKSAGVATPEQLEQINKYAIADLREDDVYIQKFLTCHNQPDRDGDRMDDGLLDDIARTCLGKSLMFDHANYDPNQVGTVFAAEVVEMTAAEFATLTGEGNYSGKVKVVYMWVYLLKETDSETIAKLKGGVYRHVSVQFTISDMDKVDGMYVLKGPGECWELSIVFLGAQNGATTQKKAKNDEDNPEPTGGEDMKIYAKLKSLFSRTDDVTEDNVETVVADEFGKLKTAAEIGEKYKFATVKKYVELKVKVGDIKAEDTAKVEALRKSAGSFDLDFLELENEALEARVKEKFPAQGQINPGDPEKKGAGAEDDDLPIN